jgi:surfeit locus 1 family protein
VKPRIIVFVALATVSAAVFVRLGVWQLDRLSERRARNAVLRERLTEAPVEFSALRDTSGYRRAIVSGSADYENELVFTGRSRNGSPGVYIVTPVRRAGNDTAIMVVRGWVYAPDAATIDMAQWRESRSTFQGFVLSLPPGVATPPGSTGRKVRMLSQGTLRPLLPYPFAPLYVVALDSASGPAAPARLDLPALDNGPHLSYAVQWFCFAAIAIGGAVIVIARSRRMP